MQTKLSPQDAAAYLGLSASFLTKSRVRGDGPPYAKLGRRVIYDLADLEAWLAANRRLSTSEEALDVGALRARCAKAETAFESLRAETKRLLRVLEAKEAEIAELQQRLAGSERRTPGRSSHLWDED